MLADRLAELGVTAAAGSCAGGLGLPLVPPPTPGPAQAGDGVVSRVQSGGTVSWAT